MQSVGPVVLPKTPATFKVPSLSPISDRGMVTVNALEPKVVVAVPTVLA